MSYYDQAEGINTDLKSLFNSIPVNEFRKDQREAILNIIIRIGQVAKFRCRSNTAYDNFMSLCFKELAEVKRVDSEREEWKTLRAFMP